MKVGILTNGTINDYNFYKERLREYELLICADGGLTHAAQMDALPDIALGDFDSTPEDVVKEYEARGCEIIKHPSIKDDTDTEIALDYALGQKPVSVDILAGLGTRFDHSLANVHLLMKGLEKDIPVRIVTENNIISLIDSHVKIQGSSGDGISLLPLTPKVENINTKGLAYVVSKGTFYIGKPYGVSNYMVTSEAEITIGQGLLLVIQYRD